MPDSDDQERAEILALAREYATRLPAMIAELDLAIDRLHDGPTDAHDAALESVIMFTHRIAGSGGMFGFRERSRRARAAEQAAKRTRDNPAGGFAETLQLTAALRELALTPGDPEL